MQLLEKACDAKNANACYYLSGMYIVGVQKDPQSKDAAGKEELRVAKDMAKAFKFALEGCNLGNMYSCANVSQMYAKGDGESSSCDVALSECL